LPTTDAWACLGEFLVEEIRSIRAPGMSVTADAGAHVANDIGGDAPGCNDRQIFFSTGLQGRFSSWRSAC